MFRSIHVWLWGIVAELEYHLYPWKTQSPPQWAIDRYNLDGQSDELPYDDRLKFDWLKVHEDKIATLQLEMRSVIKSIQILKGEKK